MTAFGGYAVGSHSQKSLQTTTITVTSTLTQSTSQQPVTTTMYFPNTNATYSTYTNPMYSTYSNTFFSTSCVITGVGGFEFRVVSDSTNAPVNPNNITAVDTLECGGENQAVYANEFSYLGGGWISPMFPSQATYGGGLNITVTYEGDTYNFARGIPPIGTDCVTLHVPSGNVSSSTAINGSGSYCS